MKSKILLHSCCGPCSTVVIEDLSKNYDVTVYYYNPNIEPFSEYEKRKEEQIRFINEYNKDIKVIIGDYKNDLYHEAISEYESLPEGSLRCYNCIKHRLENTVIYAKNNNYDLFDTTLSVSPHKNSNWIIKIGQELEEKYGIKYLGGNYKKANGYQKSIELAQKYHLYRQDYCGCLISARKSCK